MVHYHQVSKWKLVGPLLGISNEKLDIIENKYDKEHEKCCFAMFKYWRNRDPNASLEKLKEAIMRLQSIGATFDVSVVESIKRFLQHRYDRNRHDTLINLGFSYKPDNFINVAFILHKHSKMTEETWTDIGNVIYYIDAMAGRNPIGNIQPQVLPLNDYYTSCTKGTSIVEFLHNIDTIPKREPFSLLIEGAPAIGKTTTCKKLHFTGVSVRKMI